MPSLLDKLLGRPSHPRPPQFAGHLYPQDAEALCKRLDYHMALAAGAPAVTGAPSGRVVAIVSPVAELAFAAPGAAAAYAIAARHQDTITRVIIVSSAQRIPFAGIGLGSWDAWRVPSGDLRVDAATIGDLCEDERLRLGGAVRVLDAALLPEYGIESQLPWIVRALGSSVRIVAMQVGDARQADVERALEVAGWDRGDTLTVLATALAQGVSEARAEAIGDEVTEALGALDEQMITREHASSRVPLRALMSLARRSTSPLRAHAARVYHSAQVHGDEARALWSARDQGLVLGLGAFTLHAP